MKGVGSCNDWSYYASPSSNLSAFAAPFNRPNPNDSSTPFVDSSESVQPQSHVHDFFVNPTRELDSTQSATPSVSQFLYLNPMGSPPEPKDSFFMNPRRELDSNQSAKPSVAQLRNFNSLGTHNLSDQFFYDLSSTSTKPSIVEAQPYYPSYISSPNGDPTPLVAAHNYWSSSGFTHLGEYAKKSPEIGVHGLWNHNGLIGEERMKQGCQDLNGEALLLPHQMFGREKSCVPKNADHSDDKPCWWETVKPMPVEFTATSFTGSPSAPLETYLATNSVAIDSGSGNLHLPYSGSHDKPLGQHDKPSSVNTVFSTPIGGSIMDIGNTIADGDPGNNNFYNIKQAYHMPNPGTAGGFDLSHLRAHLERDKHSTSTNAMISEKVSREVVNDIFKERHGFQNPHAGLDNLSLTLNAIEDINSAEKSFEDADRCNPTLDSPCWKGAPTAHFFRREDYVALSPEYLHKKEEYIGSAIQEPQNYSLDNNNLKYPSENSNSYHCQETGLEGSSMKRSVTKDASEDCNSYGAANAGSFQTESSHDCGLQYLYDTTETKEYSVPSTRPTYVCESGSSHTLHQVLDENNLMYKKQHTLCFGGADAGPNVVECVEHSAPTTGGAEGGCNMNKCMATPYPPKDDQYKRSLASDALNTLEKTPGEVSTEKLNVQMLVDTMHNLSELLLCHCLNDACEMKERDHDILKKVINNLNVCALKKSQQIIPARECLSPKPETSRGAGEACEIQQSSTLEKPRLTNIGPESSKVEHQNPLGQEANNLHLRSKNPNRKLSDSFSSRDKAEIEKEDKMTKALKKILSENFHEDEESDSQTLLYKNLWLEAEAALCSVSYKARYNQMKIEMENHSHKQKDTEEKSNPEVVPNLSENSATKVHIDPNHDSFVQELHEFNTNFLNCINDLQFSADMNKPNAMTPEVNVTQDLDSSIYSSTIPWTDKEVEDDDASVIARFRVLKARAEKSCMNTSNLEEPSDVADKLAPIERDNQKQINLNQDSPIPGKNKADYETSVMARFHILKSRAEDSSTISSERILSDDDMAITKDDASEGNSFNAHVNASGAVFMKSIPKEEYVLDFDDRQEDLHRVTCEDVSQLPTYCIDGLVSDWEHVEKRSL
ncbi:hypothetical protein TanjilG_10760 [Lupinus angustifolius]|uniref:Uncharacterized protein n=2 Tax=Lupinus angustifolius TaxID=3871 RepID=A0A1J7HR90_LUPAN|nr:PREDICTED: uncharacterized protein LOC109343465 isoform X2 [Lupinus angustifolius]OIW15320.1 hypothetical protein TanjilG_10760 [Lupinus angustifolius]